MRVFEVTYAGARVFAQFRPPALVPCEHMFCTERTSTLAQRALGALGLARSFLMLEDDWGVDWEVDEDGPATAAHPHRVPLRGRSGARRPGMAPAPAQVCLCPVRHGARAGSRPRTSGRPEQRSWNSA
jgi:hypothetical protein